MHRLAVYNAPDVEVSTNSNFACLDKTTKGGEIEKEHFLHGVELEAAEVLSVCTTQTSVPVVTTSRSTQIDFG
jgi:hypothetical protein